MASLSSVPQTQPSTNETPEGGQGAGPDGSSLGTARARRASDGHIARLQTELKARDEEIRRLADEMASLARDAQIRIAELEQQAARAADRPPAPVTPLIRHDSADTERARAAAEQRADEAEARATAAEASAAQAASRLRDALATNDTLSADLDATRARIDAHEEGTGPPAGSTSGQSLRDRLAEAATADDADHLASG